MPMQPRHRIVSASVVLTSLLVVNAVRGMEPPALLPDALLREDFDGPPPPAVNAPQRVRQTLVPGTTYEVRVKGTMKVEAQDKKFFTFLHIQGKMTLNYAFDAVIERYIWYNDGKKIIEDRWFRDVRTMLIGTDAHDLQLRPGPFAQALLELTPAAMALVPGGPAVAVRASTALFTTLLKSSGPFLAAVSDRINRGYKVHAFAALDGLSRKRVRLYYVDGRGVERLEPLPGKYIDDRGVERLDPRKPTITPDERAFHMSSVVLSDCLLFPNDTVPVKQPYTVNAAGLADKIDPSLRANVSGTLRVTRDGDETFYEPVLSEHKLRCAVLNVKAEDLEFRSTTARTGEVIGLCNPAGKLYFDLDHHLVVAATLKASGEMKMFPPHHLLRSAQHFYKPELNIVYSCRIKTPPSGQGR